MCWSENIFTVTFVKYKMYIRRVNTFKIFNHLALVNFTYSFWKQQCFFLPKNDGWVTRRIRQNGRSAERTVGLEGLFGWCPKSSRSKGWMAVVRDRAVRGWPGSGRAKERLTGQEREPNRTRSSRLLVAAHPTRTVQCRNKWPIASSKINCKFKCLYNSPGFVLSEYILHTSITVRTNNLHKPSCKRRNYLCPMFLP